MSCLVEPLLFCLPTEDVVAGTFCAYFKYGLGCIKLYLVALILTVPGTIIDAGVYIKIRRIRWRLD